jgi:hypothetical protein
MKNKLVQLIKTLEDNTTLSTDEIIELHEELESYADFLQMNKRYDEAIVVFDLVDAIG